MADSLKVYETLKSSLTDSQARAVTLAIQQSENEATQDIKTVLERQWRLSLETFATKTDLAGLRGEVLAKLAETKAELTRWMFVFWIGQVAVTVGTVLTVARMLQK